MQGSATIDPLIQRQRQGEKLAEAYFSTKRQVRDGKLEEDELIDAINRWCAGLRDADGNDVPQILKLLLDEIQSAGRDWHTIDGFKADVLRSLAEGFSNRMEKEDPDVARGMRTYQEDA